MVGVMVSFSMADDMDGSETLGSPPPQRMFLPTTPMICPSLDRIGLPTSYWENQFRNNLSTCTI